ncbi:hypothetical protein [Sphingobium sp. AntQ-1]|uniref:hypothetical protein n=1 Tax=Sphingobium sp. AntQ-1 TaxID=2930091 RepID=UPI00234EC98A|nr:hypothetical protein [Sphingobium sp. AntQ-1]
MARYALASVFGHQKHIWLSSFHNITGKTRQSTKRTYREAALQFPMAGVNLKIWPLNHSPLTLKPSELLIGKPSPRSGNLAQYGSVAMLVMMLSAASMIAIW